MPKFPGTNRGGGEGDEPGENVPESQTGADAQAEQGETAAGGDDSDRYAFEEAETKAGQEAPQGSSDTAAEGGKSAAATRAAEEGSETEREQKSISQETTFTRDVGDESELLRVLYDQAMGVARELRRSGLCASTVRLKLRWSDFTTPTRQMTFAQPNDDGQQIYALARQLFARLWQPGQKVRLVGVGVSGLTDQPRQMGLFDPPDERSEKLTATVSAMRARFGDNALVRGSDMRRQRNPGGINQKSGNEEKPQ